MDNSEIQLRVETLSDKELIEMLENKFDYTQEAFQAAQNELEKRGGSVPWHSMKKKIENEELEPQRKEDEKRNTVKSYSSSYHNSLSFKYRTLKLYKIFLYFNMIVVTGFTIFSLVQMNDASIAIKKYGDSAMMDSAMLTTIISYVITMFSLFCMTIMIGFLFDLDRHKSDN